MKTVVITGATSGIGKATAARLAQENFRLILCGRRSNILKDLQQQLSEYTEVYTLSFDVRDQKAVQQAFESLPEEWKTIDILINNAGNAHGLDPLSAGKIEDWDTMMDGNVKGLLYVSNACIPQMKERKSGHIVNISSVAGLQTYSNGVVYCASKKAVQAISEGMRLELTEFGIKVSDIAPGAVETEFSKVRFKGDEERAATVYAGYQALQAEDIADTISYIVNAPKHVTIAALTIYPAAQSSPTTIHRSQESK
ncbi:SDR family NAD(P)-dependent oxidoreductase [Elizabethkingia sp. JS20170427COW]|uniref:SDR family NAD(P)-dependent oxidoreductase n=1 Tax=Elizabethkingia sp. JS20170427COW TaxID=2583851 RepID=UPI001110A594|nr:SDR family NAD(P)-dependent oxidoreductase [Elizabethkingia sp. JS20170427COW]QCX53131.1 SDR family NAD(P)-dependent oxidoreductase [Elizabethkingia sp. JS20170427COW]